MAQQIQQKGKPYYQDRNKEPVNREVLNNFIKTIDEKNFLDDEILKSSEKLGKFFADLGIANTPFRKFFNQFRILSGKSITDLKIQLRILQSQIAYSVGRAETGHGSETLKKEFKELLDKCINKIIASQNEKEYSNFMKFFESLYAYFYYYCPNKKS
ncbi:MAG: type III-A CRISPR-associated protein Csm2 [Candidatus Eremiobacterota bacterium]